MALRRGDRVFLHSLRGRIDLNGATGTLLSYNEKRGRWAVQVDPAWVIIEADAKGIMLKGANLAMLGAEATPAAGKVASPSDGALTPAEAIGKTAGNAAATMDQTMKAIARASDTTPSKLVCATEQCATTPVKLTTDGCETTSPASISVLQLSDPLSSSPMPAEEMPLVAGFLNAFCVGGCFGLAPAKPTLAPAAV